MASIIGSIIQFFKKLLGIGMPCAFHSITGLYCPGCGGTRAVRAFLHGDILMSFQYHPIVLYGAAVVLLEFASWELARVLKRPGLYIGHTHFFALLGAGIVVVNWFYKNYMLVFRGVDLLPLFR